ncbi:MAG: hypothetical protein ACPG6B_06380 [Oceanihabitans sp.]
MSNNTSIYISKIFIILFLFSNSILKAQNEYPKILHFNTVINTSNNSDKPVSKQEQYHFLMLDSINAIDLKEYGNLKSEFKILSSNEKAILLEFVQPSKLTYKGRCAAGTERGFLHIELNKDATISNTSFYLLESCLYFIELINTKTTETGIIKHTYQNYQTEDIYSLIINLNSTSITLKKNNLN